MKTVSGQALKTKKVLIFASGNGSNLEAIVKYFREKGLSGVEFELISDNKNAFALKRAENLGVKASYVPFSGFKEFLKGRPRFDLWVLAGFMRVLPPSVLDLAGGTLIINIHPSLLPEFKGKNAIKRAYEAGAARTGVTVHFVNEKVDGGKIIEKRSVSTKGLTLNALEEAVHGLEHSMYPRVIENLLFKKRVLLLGGGAREHAIAEKLSGSPYLERLYLAGANDGFRHLGENIDYDGYLDLFKKAKANGVNLFVVGPENPLCEGVCDIFLKGGIPVIGATKSWARLEGSKIFAKNFMVENGIKTADYKVVEAKNPVMLNEAFSYFAKKGTLPVIKADGLALGKGVSLPVSLKEAKSTAEAYLGGKFGEASRRILLEDRLFGQEVSVISLWDGKKLVSLPPASDYKRLLDDNKGENTGGMGAYAPSRVTNSQKKQIKSYLVKLESALKRSGADFCGVIYSGLILTKDEVYVLEYNMRFGDPETQALLELLDNDLLDIFIKMTKCELETLDLRLKRRVAYALTLASCGYPVNPLRGEKIYGLGDAVKSGCKVYFAGVKASKGSGDKGFSGQGFNDLLTNGGRVLNIVKSEPLGGKRSDSTKNALKDIYNTANIIDFKGKIFRTDIGR